MNWRRKRMSRDDLARLRENFTTYHRVMRNDPWLALFSRTAPGDETPTVYMYGPNVAMLERYSPGDGWEDSETPGGPGLELLVGNPDVWERLQVARA